MLWPVLCIALFVGVAMYDDPDPELVVARMVIWPVLAIRSLWRSSIELWTGRS